MLVMFCSTFPVRAPSNGLARRSTKSFSAATLLQSRERVWEQLFVVLLGVTIFFREDPTIRSETASQAVLSTSPDER